MNSLWGGLCTKNRKVKSSENRSASARGNIVDIVPTFGNTLKITYESIDKPYKFDYARLGPFLTSKGRYNLSQLMEPYQNQLIYCHTDGFVVAGHHETPKLGGDIGQLKQEAKNVKVQVTHICKIIKS